MNVLVLNMGMKSVRSIIFDENGRKLSSASRTLKSAVNDIRVEQFPIEWWDKALDVMKDAIRDAKAEKIDYITVTTSASCLVCIDDEGTPLGNAIMVSDKRAMYEVEEIRKIEECQEVEEETGLEVSVSLMLPKILWVKNNETDTFTKARYFLTPNDYLCWELNPGPLQDEQVLLTSEPSL